MADRGFTINDLLVPKKASLVIPPFMKGKKALSIHEEAVTRVIAKARIHIGKYLSLKVKSRTVINVFFLTERWNQRLKTYLWLKGPVSQKKIPILSQAVLVCSGLANFSRILAT